LTDSKLRELERRFRVSGSVEDEAAWLRARVQAGEITDECLQLACRLGQGAAAVALGRISDPLAMDERYEVVGELGRGGMGVVYRARDVTAGREVALKLTLGRLRPNLLERFRREGELTARLDHPGIVRIYSSGEIDGRPYLAYELVDGTSFSEVILSMDRRARVSVVRDAARALGHAHAQGVLHRDVKGENILVDREGRGRVADFGLATAQDQDRLTKTGSLLGTPVFMSPEMVDGRGRPLGPPSDVWSLGILLYQALTDVLPIEGGSMIEIVGRIMAGAFERPRKLSADVPPGLEQICLRALTLDPEDRYANGEALAADLDAWLDGTYRLVRGPKALVGAGIVAAVILGVAIGLVMTKSSDSTAASADPASPTTVEGVPTPDAPPTPDTVDPGVLREARAQLSTFEALEPKARVRGAKRWLSRYPRLPANERAVVEEIARKAQLEFPLLEIQHSRSTKTYSGAASQTFRVKGFFLGNERILTQGADLKLRCWKVSDPHESEWVMDCGEPLTSGLAVHPDGSAFVVSMGKDSGVVHAVDAATRVARALPGGPFDGIEVRNVIFSPNGKTLLLGMPYVGVFQYRWPSLELVRKHEFAFVRDLDVSPNSRLFAACGGPWREPGEPRSFLRVWNLESGKLELEQVDVNMRAQVAFDPSGESLVVGTQAGALYMILLDDPDSKHPFLAPTDEESGTWLALGKAHGGVPTGLAFGADGVTLFSTSNSPGPGMPSELRVWDFPSRYQARMLQNQDASFISITRSPDRKRVLVGTGIRTVQVHAAQQQ
jgi:WD40 repeat protein/predicted Ser/Thr protein kinase